MIKLFFEAIDTVYLIFGSILIIIAYVYSSDGIFGIPASLTTGLIGAGITFALLLLPYYFLSKIKKSNKKNSFLLFAIQESHIQQKGWTGEKKQDYRAQHSNP